MLGTGPRRVLGLAIGEKAIHVAEVHAARSAGRLVRRASFAISSDAGWDKPQELGQRLRAFLRSEHFAARQVVAGLPGRWVLLKPRALPPVVPRAAVDILRLAVEREYQADARQWVFDFAGAPDAGQKTTVLLAATPQERLTQVTATLEAAGLRVLAVTSTTLALALARPAANEPGGAVLHLSPEGAELAVRSQGRVVAVERLAGGVAQVSAADAAEGSRSALVAGEIRRALASAQPDAAGPAQTLTIWDSTGVNGPALGDLGRRVGLTARINPDLHELGVLNGTVNIDGNRDGGAGAVALALEGLRRPDGRADFLHSRLAVERRRLVTQRRALAAAVVLLLLGVGIYFVIDWYGKKREVAQMQAKLNQYEKPLKAANANLDRLKLVRGWYDTRPPMLDCFHDVTQAFPLTAGQVWATSLVVHEDLTGTLLGKAQDERNALELRDRLMASKRFSDVRLLSYQQQTDRNNRGVSFALTFVYKGRE